MSGLQYRLATPEDLTAASRLVRQVFDAQVAPLYEAEGCALFYRFIEPAVWAERDRVAPRTWLAFAGRKLVGVAHVRSGRQLSLLFVEVGRQRQGVAKGLLGQVVSALGAGPLDVHASPNAVVAYERLGFVRLGAEVAESGLRYIPMRREIRADDNDGLPPPPVAYAARVPFFAEAKDLRPVGRDVQGREARLAPAAALAWEQMCADALREGVPLLLVSAFRSVGRQREIVRRKLESGQALAEILKVSAYPGFSEHHTGCAVDVAAPDGPRLTEAFAGTPQFRWLSEHAHEYGFALSYPKGNKQGLAYEPWHWCWREGLAPERVT